MYESRLTRDEQPIPGHVFVAIPFGKKTTSDGRVFDFDWLFTDVISPIIREAGMHPVRSDSIYGPTTVFDMIWRGIQRAELMVVDFSCQAANVAMEYMAGRLIGKRMIYLAQDPEDIPSDVRGLRYIQYSELYADMNQMREMLLAQLAAVREEPAQEMALIPMATGGTVVPTRAQVISVSRDFVVVQAADGARGVLGGEDVDWNRIVPDMTRKYAVGDRLDGAFEITPSGGMKYTLLTGPNPWKELAAAHPVGSRCTGIVHSVREPGVFVRVGFGITGLVPRSTLPHGVVPSPGEEVEVSVIEIDQLRRRLALALHGGSAGRRTTRPAKPATTMPDLKVGDRLEGEVIKAVPEGKGGYVLLTVEGRERPVFLHCTAMTPELRRDLNDGQIERGELIDLEVVSVDPARNKVFVRDLPDLEDTAQAA